MHMNVNMNMNLTRNAEPWVHFISRSRLKYIWPVRAHLRFYYQLNKLIKMIVMFKLITNLLSQDLVIFKPRFPAWFRRLFSTNFYNITQICISCIWKRVYNRSIWCTCISDFVWVIEEYKLEQNNNLLHWGTG